MNKTEIMGSLTRTFHKTGLTLKKHSPEILLVTGVVGVVASTVMACKATLKVDEIVDETKETIDRIHEAKEAGVTQAGEEYIEEDSTKDLAITYIQTGVKFAKLYGPSVVLGVASIGCILGSHNIIRKRNIALAAAYTAVDTSFKEYRGRVIDRFGKDLDRELKYGIKAEEVEETVVDENGKEKTVKKTIQVADEPKPSEYAKFFDEYCKGWQKDPDYNLMYLRNMQSFANDKLRCQGFLFLNDVYEMLGIPKTKAGQIVGWIYDKEHPIGDNYVDFGIYDLDSESKRLFVNGHERSILLDFNVDGPILEYI